MSLTTHNSNMCSVTCFIYILCCFCNKKPISFHYYTSVLTGSYLSCVSLWKKLFLKLHIMNEKWTTECPFYFWQFSCVCLYFLFHIKLFQSCISSMLFISDIYLIKRWQLMITIHIVKYINKMSGSHLQNVCRTEKYMQLNILQ